MMIIWQHKRRKFHFVYKTKFLAKSFSQRNKKKKKSLIRKTCVTVKILQLEGNGEEIIREKRNR